MVGGLALAFSFGVTQATCPSMMSSSSEPEEPGRTPGPARGGGASSGDDAGASGPTAASADYVLKLPHKGSKLKEAVPVGKRAKSYAKNGSARSGSDLEETSPEAGEDLKAFGYVSGASTDEEQLCAAIAGSKEEALKAIAEANMLSEPPLGEEEAKVIETFSPGSLFETGGRFYQVEREALIVTPVEDLRREKKPPVSGDPESGPPERSRREARREKTTVRRVKQTRTVGQGSAGQAASPPEEENSGPPPAAPGRPEEGKKNPPPSSKEGVPAKKAVPEWAQGLEEKRTLIAELQKKKKAAPQAPEERRSKDKKIRKLWEEVRLAEKLAGFGRLAPEMTKEEARGVLGEIEEKERAPLGCGEAAERFAREEDLSAKQQRKQPRHHRGEEQQNGGSVFSKREESSQSAGGSGDWPAKDPAGNP